MNYHANRMFELAFKQGAMPEVIAVGQVYELTDHLLKSGEPFAFDRNLDHERIVITQVPGGRKRTFRFRKLNPQARGNGRPDRGEHKLALVTLARNYRLVPSEGTER